MCIAASQSCGRRRRVLAKIRAKREITVKTEDPGDMSEQDNGGGVDSSGSQTSVYNAISPSDIKSLLAEYVLCMLCLA